MLNAPITNPHPEWPLRISTDGENQISMLKWIDISNQLMSVTPSEVTITVAADSGAVDHVIHPNDLPAGCVLSGANGEHFIGASGEHIDRFGEVDIVITMCRCDARPALDLQGDRARTRPRSPRGPLHE